MLGLTLRQGFKGRRLNGSAIELTNKNNSGATQIPATDCLKITCPTADVLKTLGAAESKQNRSAALMGGRGQGRSHFIAGLFHVFNDNAAMQQWLSHWTGLSSNDRLRSIPHRGGLHVICESLHRQRYRLFKQQDLDDVMNQVQEPDTESKSRREQPK